MTGFQCWNKPMDALVPSKDGNQGIFFWSCGLSKNRLKKLMAGLDGSEKLKAAQAAEGKSPRHPQDALEPQAERQGAPEADRWKVRKPVRPSRLGRYLKKEF
jgi:hypothetical protein